MNLNIKLKNKGENEIMAQFVKSGKMISNNVDTYLANAKVYDGDNAIEAPNGGLVVLGDLLADTTYDEKGVEYDSYKAEKPAASTDEIAIIDYAGIQELVDGENNSYKLGINMYNLTVPAGEFTRVRRLGLHDKFWLAEGNFDAAPTVGEYGIADAGKFTHKASAEKATSGYCVKILDKKGLTTGMKDNGYMYLVEVISL